MHNFSLKNKIPRRVMQNTLSPQNTPYSSAACAVDRIRGIKEVLVMAANFASSKLVNSVSANNIFLLFRCSAENDSVYSFRAR